MLRQVILTTLLLGSVTQAASQCVDCTDGGMSAGAPCSDLSGETWANGLSLAIDRLKQEYAFRKWKGIDFDAIKAKYVPEAEAAMALNATDHTAAMRKYASIVMNVFNMPDKHFIVLSLCASAEYNKAMGDYQKEMYGGGYGFIVAPLDDYTTIVTYVVPGSDAESNGVAEGMVLTDVDGTDIESYVHGLDMTWTGLHYTNQQVNQPATTELIRLDKFRLITRGPDNADRTFTFWSEGAPKMVTLKAKDDEMDTWAMSQPKNVPPGGSSTDIKTHILPSGVGYLTLGSVYFSKEDLEAAFQNLNGTKAVIVDIRGGDGGNDADAAKFQAIINRGPGTMFYEKLWVTNGAVTNWCNMPGQKENVEAGLNVDCASHTDPDGWFLLQTTTSTVESTGVKYTGALVALVNGDAESSSEGVTMVIKNLGPKRGAVVGFTGTAASFGLAGATMKIPGGHQVGYPFGYSGNIMNKIQLDSDVNGIGGVQPTHKIPRTADRMIAFQKLAYQRAAQGVQPWDVAFPPDLTTDVELAYAEEVAQSMTSMMPITCGTVKKAYKSQKCCAMPDKHFTMPK